MINRRHIRIKVMQSFYALLQSKSDDIVREEKFLYFSIDKLQHLFVLQIILLSKVQGLAKKRLDIASKGRVSTIENKQGFENLVNNSFLKIIEESLSLKEFITNKNIDSWKDATEYLQIILDQIKESPLFIEYGKLETPSFKDDKNFVITVFKELVAPNEKLMDFYEDQYIGWLDDLPFVNTIIVKHYNKISENGIFELENLYKDDDDRAFVRELFRKSALHHLEFDKDIDEKTPNWEYDRIAEMDLILIKLALTEFLYFPLIPTKVTINEYLEIAKDYSSDKSSFFVNGVLDRLEKEYKKAGKIKKIGRGLI